MMTVRVKLAFAFKFSGTVLVRKECTCYYSAMVDDWQFADYQQIANLTSDHLYRYTRLCIRTTYVYSVYISSVIIIIGSIFGATTVLAL